MKRVLAILNGAVIVALMLVIAGAAVLAISARRSHDRVPTVLGHKVLTVLSGSMAPTIYAGDIIIVQPLAPGAEIHRGDIITFRSQEDSQMLITHRVVGMVLINGQAAAYATKGDANDSADLTPLAPDRIMGRYSWRLPFLGYIAQFLRTKLGVITIIVIPSLLLIGSEFRKMWRVLSEAEKAHAAGGGGVQQ